MNRRQFVKGTAIASAAMILSGGSISKAATNKKRKTIFRLLRHATLVVEVAGKTILVDPMLSKKEAMDPIKNAPNTNRIPLVDLPIDEAAVSELLNKIDAVLVTHTHRDHWDATAQQLIPKDKLIFCQPADETKIKEQGFINVQAIQAEFNWDNIKIHRTGGQHGTGEIGKLMGEVSGYVLEYKKERLYIAGDTIWCAPVKEAITKHLPTHIIINGGGARFLEGDAITMTIEDLLQLAQFTKTNITVVHLNTINHCLQRRTDFIEAINKNNLVMQVNVPNDGERITI